MPNIWTHLLFGDESMNAVGLSSWIEDPKLRNLFHMGCQGPDFLFYHHFLPWQKDKMMNRIGSAMHNEACGPVLVDFITHTDPLDRELAVYMLGFVLHHILDRNMHPYVFYRSGSRKWDHQRFEVLMDTHVVKQKLGLETWKMRVTEQIDTGGRFPEQVVDAFERVVQQYYPAFHGHVKRDTWNDANRAMISAQNLFYDPHGWKRIATLWQMEALVYKRKVDPYDVMNEARLPWLDPTGSGETFATSIWDMWDAAAADAETVLRSILRYWELRQSPDAEKDSPYEAVLAAIGNRSYETGLDLELHRPITVEDPIWAR